MDALRPNDASSTSRTRSRAAPVVLLLVAFLVQALLWLNPGYFSHDELQWAAFADVSSVAQLPWVSWTDVATFQFRPLTFNLWLLASHYLAETPRLFHALHVALGSANAVLLFCLLRREVGERAAAIGAVAFLFSPYVAYVHGWVATLADLLWLGLALTIAWLVRRFEGRGRHRELGVAALLLTALALLAKEAAVSIPALLGLAWLLSRFKRDWGFALVGSAVAGIGYLLWRIAPIVGGSSEGHYQLVPAAVPMRLVEYLLFAWVPNRLEPVALFDVVSSARLLFATAMLAAFMAAMVGASRWLAWIWLAAAVLALAPVLVLSQSAAQYGYGLAAVTAACAAWVWQHGGRVARGLLILPVVALMAHGLQVQVAMYRVGTIQQTFHRDVLRELERSPDPIRLQLPDANDWVFRRLTLDIPRYRGVVIGDRVGVADRDETATHRVDANGVVSAR